MNIFSKTVSRVLVGVARASVRYGARRGLKVGVVGAGSEVGRPLGLMLSIEPGVQELTVCDAEPATTALLKDLAIVPSNGTVRALNIHDQLDTALAETDLILIAGGIAPSPYLTQTTLLRANLGYITSIMSQIASIRPMPFVGLITEPLNAVFPRAVDLVQRSMNDSKKMFGIASIDALRAAAIYANLHGMESTQCRVPVIGGCSPETAVPLLSQATPFIEMDKETAQTFTTNFRCLEDKIVTLKKGRTSNLSRAYGALTFTRAMIDVINNNGTAQVPAMIANNDMGTRFLTGCVNVNKSGVDSMHRFTNLTLFECELLKDALKQLQRDIGSVNNIMTISS